MNARWLAACVFFTSFLVCATGAAHPLAPVALTVERSGGEVVVTFKRARVQPRGASLAPVLPEACEQVGLEVSDHPEHVEEVRRFDCGGRFEGLAIGVTGLSEADLDAVVRVVDGGSEQRALLDRTGDRVSIGAPPPAPAAGLRAFVVSGLEHLATGWDHLLFVLGLVLLLRRARPVLLALTAFTVGHGLSMSLALLTAPRWIPGTVAEIAIAMSLVWLAYAVLQRKPDDETGMKRPYAAALGIGLVHGLGFASAFASAGLDGADLASAVGAFHLGIELGQLTVVALGLAVLRLTGTRRRSFAAAVAYATGGVAVMWVIERSLQLVS